MYKIIRPSDPADGAAPAAPVFHQRLAYIADVAWRGYSTRDLNWRLKYYDALLSFARPDGVARIMEYYDERKKTVEDCAFVTILPLRKDIAELHLSGHFSQYKFGPQHLIVHGRRSKRVKSYHYVQSVFLGRGHRNSQSALEALRGCIVDLLRVQQCGYQGRPYILYAETTLTPGKNLCTNHGLKKSQSKSFEGCDFFVFDADDPSQRDAKVDNVVRGLWRKRGAPTENAANAAVELTQNP